LPEYHKDAAQLMRLVAPDYHPELLYLNVRQALDGDPLQNIELQEFDTIKIFSRWEMEEMPQVRISGEVQRPGAYQLFKGMRVRDLLVFAGNLKLTAFTENAEVSRTYYSGSAVTTKPILINLAKALAGDPQHNILLEKFDELYVRMIPNWSQETERYVTLRGEFQFPGSYPIYRGERLSSVIRRAGGYTSQAYLPAAKLTRVSVQQQQQQRMDESLQRAELKMSTLQSAAASKEEVESNKATLETLQKSIEKMRTVRAEGRVVIRLPSLARFEKSEYDLVLEGGDLLVVPPSPGVVHVLGNVYNQTSFVYKPGKDSLSHYLQLAGGPTNEADTAEMYLVKSDGTVISKSQKSFWDFWGFGMTPVDQGDTVVVPQKLEKTAWLREIKDITQILSNVALAAGSVYLWFK
jgi:protein involved in polysaccharide export with SLBB domain